MRRLMGARVDRALNSSTEAAAHGIPPHPRLPLNLKYFKLTKVTTDRRTRKPQRPYLVGRIDKD